MSDQFDPAHVAERIEEMLAAMDEAGSRAGEELVRLLMRFYGAGLEQVVAITRAAGGDAAVARLASDPLVGGLLALHDLHPVDLRTRVEHAMDTAHRRLGSHADGARLLGIDVDGTVRVEVSAGGCGAETVREIVSEAVTAAAPDSPGVSFVDAVRGPTLLQIGMRSS
ncbi:MAG: NifU family protein [Pseudonocardia sp.]|nr:NifU family protein [Pseudonocardia sp.]